MPTGPRPSWPDQPVGCASGPGDAVRCREPPRRGRDDHGAGPRGRSRRVVRLVLLHCPPWVGGDQATSGERAAACSGAAARPPRPRRAARPRPSARRQSGCRAAGRTARGRPRVRTSARCDQHALPLGRDRQRRGERLGQLAPQREPSAGDAYSPVRQLLAADRRPGGAAARSRSRGSGPPTRRRGAARPAPAARGPPRRGRGSAGPRPGARDRGRAGRAPSRSAGLPRTPCSALPTVTVSRVHGRQRRRHRRGRQRQLDQRLVDHRGGAGRRSASPTCARARVGHERAGRVVEVGDEVRRRGATWRSEAVSRLDVPAAALDRVPAQPRAGAAQVAIAFG